MTDKMKAGDRVAATGLFGGRVEGVIEHFDLINDTLFIRRDDDTLCRVWQVGATIVPPAKPSPVRKVTRLEIVPGEYGMIGVGAREGDCVPVGFLGHGHVDDYPILNSRELREVTHILTMLADALDQIEGASS